MEFHLKFKSPVRKKHSQFWKNIFYKSVLGAAVILINFYHFLKKHHNRCALLLSDELLLIRMIWCPRPLSGPDSATSPALTCPPNLSGRFCSCISPLPSASHSSPSPPIPLPVNQSLICMAVLGIRILPFSYKGAERTK